MGDVENLRRLALGLRERKTVVYADSFVEEHRDDEDDDDDDDDDDEEEEGEENDDEGGESEEEDNQGDSDDDMKARRSYRRLGQERVRYTEADDNSDEEEEEIEEEKRRLEVKRLAETATALLDENDERTVMRVKEIEHVVSHRLHENAPSSTLPTIDNTDVQIKWKRRSHLHDTWVRSSDLSSAPGYRKVLNYIKNMRDRIELMESLSPEEGEQMQLEDEMESQLIEQHKEIERIVAKRIVENDDGGSSTIQYLCKFRGLPYSETTWEDGSTIENDNVIGAADALLEYSKRGTRHGTKSVNAGRKAFRELIDHGFNLTEQPECVKGGTLRDYQLEALNWMLKSWSHNRPFILADEMGLGKTCQSISLLSYIKCDLKVDLPVLLIVPLSVITNWQNEFKKWAPDINVVLYVGDGQSREVIREFEFYGNDSESTDGDFLPDVILTTYDIIQRDTDVFDRTTWSVMMLDEAHRLKNVNSKIFQVLMDYDTKTRVLITGTPLQNNLKELWALLHFIAGEQFNDYERFEELYSMDSGTHTTDQGNRLRNIHRLLKKYVIRRVVKDVEKSLPPKTERILRVAMSPLQKQYYKWILKKNVRDLNKGASGSGQVSLLNIVVELQKCCNHPFLFQSADVEYRGRDGIHEGASELERMVLSSSKMTLLDKLLDRLKADNHRVLIFSQMVRMLDVIADYLRLKGYHFQRLDGRTPARDRQHSMDHFNAPGSTDFCFLLSTRAGGLGINLATADTVVIFDSDWNPKNDLQAIARAHRIGQKDAVNIYRFVVKDSVEENILERAKQKMVLDHLIIQRMDASGRTVLGGNKRSTVFDKNELATILRFGAEGLFRDEEGNKVGGEDHPEKLEEEHPDKDVDGDKGIEHEENGSGSEKNTSGGAGTTAPTDELDLDMILSRAEKVDTNKDEDGAGEELLGAFKIADFDNNETDEAFWNRLIKPEKQSVKRQEELMPRRARLVEKTYKESGIDHEWSQGNASKKSAAANGDSRKKIPCHVRAIDMEESSQLEFKPQRADAVTVKKLVMTYGAKPSSDNLRRFRREALGQDESRSDEDLIALGNLLVTGCRQAVSAFSRQDVEATEIKEAILDFYGLAVKASVVIERIEGLAMLYRKIGKCKYPLHEFHLENSRFRPPKWAKGKQASTSSCSWTANDDAYLLIGICRHGCGNWDAIRADPDLDLDKIPSSHDTDGIPKGHHLDTRASTLLKELTESALESRGGPKQILKPVMKQLKGLQDVGNLQLSRREVIDRTKRYLLAVGDFASKVIRQFDEDEQEESTKKIWMFIAQYTKGDMKDVKLRDLYEKLTARRAQAFAEKVKLDVKEDGHPENNNTSVSHGEPNGHSERGKVKLQLTESTNEDIQPQVVDNNENVEMTEKRLETKIKFKLPPGAAKRKDNGMMSIASYFKPKEKAPRFSHDE